MREQLPVHHRADQAPLSLADNQTLQICLRLRIPVVSVYAFAIDNFNRPQEEVDALMSLARSSLQEICAKG